MNLELNRKIEQAKAREAEVLRREILWSSRHLAYCGLPHRQLRKADGSLETEYSRTAKIYNIRLQEIGFVTVRLTSMDSKVGLPHSGLDRALLAWLQTKAVEQGSPTVRWSGAVPFLRDMGLDARGGAAFNRFRASFRRLAATTISFSYRHSVEFEAAKQNVIISEWLIPSKSDMRAEKRGHRRLYDYVVTLSDSVWKELKANPVAYDLKVMSKLIASPLAWDMMMFLYARTRLMRPGAKDVYIPWSELVQQLGTECGDDDRFFRHRVKQAAKKVQEAWPDLNLIWQYKGGFTLCNPNTVQPTLATGFDGVIDGEVLPQQPPEQPTLYEPLKPRSSKRAKKADQQISWRQDIPAAWLVVREPLCSNKEALEGYIKWQDQKSSPEQRKAGEEAFMVAAGQLMDSRQVMDIKKEVYAELIGQELVEDSLPWRVARRVLTVNKYCDYWGLVLPKAPAPQ